MNVTIKILSVKKVVFSLVQLEAMQGDSYIRRNVYSSDMIYLKRFVSFCIDDQNMSFGRFFLKVIIQSFQYWIFYYYLIQLYLLRIYTYRVVGISVCSFINNGAMTYSANSISYNSISIRITIYKYKITENIVSIVHISFGIW